MHFALAFTITSAHSNCGDPTQLILQQDWLLSKERPGNRLRRQLYHALKNWQLPIVRCRFANRRWPLVKVRLVGTRSRVRRDTGQTSVFPRRVGLM